MNIIYLVKCLRNIIDNTIWRICRNKFRGQIIRVYSNIKNYIISSVRTGKKLYLKIIFLDILYI